MIKRFLNWLNGTTEPRPKEGEIWVEKTGAFGDPMRKQILSAGEIGVCCVPVAEAGPNQPPQPPPIYMQYRYLMEYYRKE